MEPGRRSVVPLPVDGWRARRPRGVRGRVIHLRKEQSHPPRRDEGGIGRRCEDTRGVKRLAEIGERNRRLRRFRR